jgi:putative nucleotidyltransferase with HDIG domain
MDNDMITLVTLFAWAYEVAAHKLADLLPQRWAHVQGVARQASDVRSVAGSDADLLESAAILHDVGYAPDLVRTGFHPLDGANFLHEIEAPSRLVHLVAHHSDAALEAELRGLSSELAEYEDERGSLRDALWYCDLTTGPEGDPVDARERIAEIQQRYGPGHLVTEFITNASPELLDAVDRTRRRAVALAR